MAHHFRIVSLHSLANAVRGIIGQCYHGAGQYALFKQHVPQLSAFYIANNDMDWIKFSKAACEIKTNSNVGYMKVKVPVTKPDDIFEVNLLSWLPDAYTKIHDHPTYLATSTTVITGALAETLYVKTQPHVNQVSTSLNKIYYSSTQHDMDDLSLINYQDIAYRILEPGMTSTISGDQLHSMMCHSDTVTHTLQICLQNDYLPPDGRALIPWSYSSQLVLKEGEKADYAAEDRAALIMAIKM